MIFREPRLDLTAQLVPGASAAGFTIGTPRSIVEAAIGPATTGRHVSDLRQNDGWMRFRYDRGYGVFLNYTFKDSVVELTFSGDGPLSGIIVGNGYAGDYLGIRVGSDLASVTSRLSLVYDEGDEVYYIGNGEIEQPRIYFEGSSRAPLELEPLQSVSKMSVHDWDLERLGWIRDPARAGYR